MTGCRECRRRVLQRWPLLMGRKRTSLKGLPFSRASLRRHTRIEIRPRRTPGACLTQWLMSSDSWRSLRGSARNRLRSSPFCKPGASNCRHVGLSWEVILFGMRQWWGHRSALGGGRYALKETDAEKCARGGEESRVVAAIIGGANIIGSNLRSGWCSRFELVAEAWAHDGL
jgi:hypothetical protein